MDADGAVESATITQARISPGDDFKVDVVNGPTTALVQALNDHADKLNQRLFSFMDYVVVARR